MDRIEQYDWISGMLVRELERVVERSQIGVAPIHHYERAKIALRRAAPFYGFKQGPESWGLRMYHKTEGVILKSSHLSGAVPQAAIPTIPLLVDGGGDDTGRLICAILLQPLVDPLPQSTLNEIFNRRHLAVPDGERKRLFGADSHSGNFGVWRGAVVAYDW